MKKLAFYVLLAAAPFVLVACGKATNTNVATIDLTNTSTNTNAAANVNAVGNANVSANTNVSSNTNTASTNPTNTNATSATVSITSSGFSPKTLTVKSGTVVTWTNSSGSTARVASDPHPTHTDLPGLDSGQLADSDAYSFTFTQIGTWGYHDHENSSTRGTVVVE